jgi:hypothetical protein
MLSDRLHELTTAGIVTRTVHPGPPARTHYALTELVDVGVDWPSLQAQLEGNGGYCDCEVLLNVPGVSDDEPEPD